MNEKQFTATFFLSLKCPPITYTAFCIYHNIDTLKIKNIFYADN